MPATHLVLINLRYLTVDVGMPDSNWRFDREGR